MEQILTNALSGQGIWCILFVFLLLYVIKTTSQREDRLMAHIDRLDDSQAKIVIRLDKIEDKIK